MGPPKPKAASAGGADVDGLVELFKTIGLAQSKAAEAAKSPKSAAVLKELIQRHDLPGKNLDEKQGTLMAALATQGGRLGEGERSYVLNAILDGRLKSTDQVNAAVKHLDSHPLPVDQKEFDRECGVGYSITPEELYTKVTEYVSSAAVSGWNNLGASIGALKGTPELRWANPLELKSSVERAFTERFGSREAAKAKGKEVKKEAPSKPTAASAAPAPEASTSSVFEQGFLGSLHKVGENPQLHEHLRQAHLEFTKGKVHTRFPPEPNGFLHIGHSKAIFVNFGYAAHHGGHCYLRYDDTNPEKEEARYFESILEMVRWLGYEPWMITYSSDHFQRLYDLAVELIRRDKGYVCNCTPEEIKANRGGEMRGPRIACAHRTRPISESLAEFQKMKDGHYKPGQAVLRMKQDLEDGNPQMWDLIAYRVLETPHHRTGDKWKIYPTYDFTHCLCDSFENITHSLCTTEFIASRQSYEWLCDALEVYKPRQSEYGRLNIEGTLMSKRKILALVNEGYVNGWDDPRLYTLIALRRRGVPPGAIVSFVSGLGVSTAASNIQVARFEQSVRSYLENTAPRLLMVLNPLRVTIENIPDGEVVWVEKPLHPKVPELGMSRIPFTKHIFIDKDDFRTVDSKEYFRLAPHKTVGLFQAPHPITCTSYKTDPATGEVTELICRLEDGKDGKAPQKPKAFIQWVAELPEAGSPVRVDETRIFHRLFRSDNPAAVEPDFRVDINPNSLEVVKGALVEVGFWELAKKAYEDAKREGKERTDAARANQATNVNALASDDTPVATSEQLVGKECVRFQGLRVAYFALDKDSWVACLDEKEGVKPGRREGDYIVLNRIVSLKEDAGKSA
ncbi:glutaminyl-tRNA synthetase [Gloeophyllum trabeum ATCC 11539]|uniref:glutamine--tRNA ligase n=1 Tax=Gloeophyllum trabeum (strain ATCC 11539 / FP-39264 / Madison 617) TaxID=670483 RepID=S7QIF6_GLOTA|nr:glutaminyl-tRNA synthetase [Gloeophyllum trabeum ATCC 11539]EPQ59008.1 glutaminyl-tRNA synthetase [Gloeophyllum trabeum ATCC 11539]